MYKSIVRSILLLLATALFLPTLQGQNASLASGMNLWQQTFEVVWQTVRDKHFDPNMNGVDWNAVHDRYAPKVAAIKREEELYPLLSQMLNELKESHFGIIPSAAVVKTVKGEPGDAGLEVKELDGQLVITEVTSSAAARAGVKTGFIITAVDGKAVSEVRDRLAKLDERPTMKKFLMGRAGEGLLAGAVGSSVTLECLDGQNQPQKFTFSRQPLAGEPLKFGNLPTEFVQFDAHHLPDGVGYIRFNIFLTPIIAQFQSAMKDFKNAPGIIIDLRGNPGGLGAISSGLARSFYTEKALLGTMKQRTGDQKFVVFPNPDAFTGPVVILIDEGSASTSEVMAGGMQENGRAIIVGQNSTGAVLPSLIQDLPTGAKLQFAVADFKTPKGMLLEGVGVKPDYETPLKRSSLLAGHDDALEKAMSIIEKHQQPK